MSKRQQYDMVTVVGREGGPAQRPGDSTSEDGSVVYNRAHDELTILTGTGSWLRLAPGERLAQRVAQAMTRAETSVEQLATLPNVGRCPVCGAMTRLVQAGPTTKDALYLDAKPDERGIYLLTGEKTARTLQPMEEPTAPTYAPHSCRRGKA